MSPQIRTISSQGKLDTVNGRLIIYNGSKLSKLTIFFGFYNYLIIRNYTLKSVTICQGLGSKPIDYAAFKLRSMRKLCFSYSDDGLSVGFKERITYKGGGGGGLLEWMILCLPFSSDMHSRGLKRTLLVHLT